MGITTVTVAVKNPNQPKRRVKTDLLVDTGSILTWISEKKLQKLGMKPRRARKFKTIEGRIVTRSTGPALLSYDGAETDIEVVYAHPEDAEVLGVTALESLGYRVDPVSQKLEQVGLLAI